MIVSFALIFTVLLQLIKCELTLERIDAIADLAAVANKYFSKDPSMQYPPPDAKVLNSFAWSVSEMWDQSESPLYVLTRLASFVDERDENGELTMPARAIKSFAGQSEARQVYFTTVEASTVEDFSSVEGDERGEIEGMYSMGREQEADRLVSEMIKEQWNGPEKVIRDIETAAASKHFQLMAAFIRLGAAGNEHFKGITSDQKGRMLLNLMAMREMQLDPVTAKWLLTMETFREDQLKLVKQTEKNLKTVEKIASPTNALVNILREVERAATPIEAISQSDYFMTAASESESLYKMAQTEDYSQVQKSQKQQKEQKSQKSQKSLKRTDSKASKRENTMKNNEENKEQNSEQTNANKETVTTVTTATDVTAKTDKTDATSEIKPTDKDYFDEVEARDREIEKGIFEVNDDPYYDNDGVYDEQEQAEDKAAWIAVVAVIGAIIVIAVGSYIYLRVRRAKRNRTMLVVTEALETVA